MAPILLDLLPADSNLCRHHPDCPRHNPVFDQLQARAGESYSPLTGFAFLVLVAAVVMMVMVISNTLNVAKFWDRFLI